MFKIMFSSVICLILTFMVSDRGGVMAQTPGLDIILAMDKISYVMGGDVDNNGTVDQDDAIKIVITLVNTGTGPIITEDGFSNQDFRKSLNFIVMGDNGTVIAMIAANNLGGGGDSPPPDVIPVLTGGVYKLSEVVPVEVITPGLIKEVEIPNAHSLYTLTAGYICVKAVISMSAYSGIYKTEGGVDYAELGDYDFAGVIESNQVCFYLNSDGDGDGYYYPEPFGVNTVADCDDNDFNINPGKVEITGNGIDDDCNLLTSDDEPAVCIADLSANATSSMIQIEWTHLAGTDYYEILRRENPSDPFSVIDTTTSTYSVYIDYSVVVDTTYHYYVRSVWDGGNSSCDSNETSATPERRSRR